MPTLNQKTVTDLTAHLVATYVLHNDLPTADLPALINRVGATLAALSAPPVPVKPEPAVDVQRSVTAAVLVCLACGGKFRTIKRHLRVAHGMTPADYRDAYGLSADYPLVAPAYAEMRATIARETGLGGVQQRRRRAR